MVLSSLMSKPKPNSLFWSEDAHVIYFDSGTIRSLANTDVKPWRLLAQFEAAMLPCPKLITQLPHAALHRLPSRAVPNAVPTISAAPMAGPMACTDVHIWRWRHQVLLRRWLHPHPKFSSAHKASHEVGHSAGQNHLPNHWHSYAVGIT